MPPDVLILTVHTVGWDSCGCCGGGGQLQIDGAEMGCAPCGGKGGQKLVCLIQLPHPEEAAGVR